MTDVANPAVVNGVTNVSSFELLSHTRTFPLYSLDVSANATVEGGYANVKAH
jgi:hypothetical protein